MTRVSVVLLFYMVAQLTANSQTNSTPNFLIILTDDQDLHLNGLEPMHDALKHITESGMFFTNYFVNTPICCPSRSTLLTGKYAHNTQVVNNSLNGNCFGPHWREKFEPKSVAALLKKDRPEYRTFYAGKYLNEYLDHTHIPEGYDEWVGLLGNSKYYNYSLSINGVKHHFTDVYLTELLRNRTLHFINGLKGSQTPFFIIVAPSAPHAPFTPAPQYSNAYSNAKAIRTASFNYSSYDKHWLVTMKPNHLPTNVSVLDMIQRNRMRTLLSVNEMLVDIIKSLKQNNMFHNTYTILTSDNGFHIGQFTQPWDKRQPYQPDVNVPFVISGPGIPPKKVTHHAFSAVDVTPTIMDLANIEYPKVQFDGNSIKDTLFGGSTQHSPKNIFVEYWGEHGKFVDVDACDFKLSDSNSLSECSRQNLCKCQDSRNNTYSCLIRISSMEMMKVCQFVDNMNILEVYDLKADPSELYNIAPKINKHVLASYIRKINDFRKCTGRSCQYSAYYE